MSKKLPRKERRFRAVGRLDAIEITVDEPCTVPWETMKGDRFVRECSVCNLNVYDFAGMQPDQILALINQSEGRLCAQFYARFDGTMTVERCDRRGEEHQLMRGGLVISSENRL